MQPDSQNLSITCGGAAVPNDQMPGSLPETLARAAQHSSHRGITFIEDEKTQFLPYPDLVTEAQKLLKGLRASGLTPGDPVIFQFESNRDFITAFWGCVIGGFVPVPIAVPPSVDAVDGSWLRLRNAWQLLDKPPVLAGRQIAAVIEDVSKSAGLTGLRILPIDAIYSTHGDTDWYQARRRDLALLMLTSGSTGMPKAVSLSHHNLLSRSAGSIQFNTFTADDISLNWMPLDHVGGIIYFHLRDVFLGADQIHAPTHLVLQDPLKWLDWTHKHRVSITWAPNFAFSLLVDQAERIYRGNWDLSCLTHIMNGGEAVVAKTGRRFLSLLEAHGLPKGAMHPAFGMAEISSGITYSHAYDLDTISDSDPFVAVGKPIPGVSLRITDDRDKILKQGAVGELQVKGETVMSGYYNAPEKTRAVFTPDGWFKTGDLGLIKDGILTITGRDKDEIVVHGNNVYPHEIEAAVEELPGIKVSFTAACAVRSAAGDTDDIALFFVPEGIPDDREMRSLIRNIRQAIIRKTGGAGIHIIPMTADDIPKTSLGKIQRPQLKTNFQTGAFDDILAKWESLENELLKAEAKASQPQSRVEQRITDIWKAVLNLPELGIHHNFFELGGHSLLLIRAHARLKPIFPGLKITDFFKYPTVHQLARHLSCKENQPSDATRARERIALKQTLRSPENNEKGIAQGDVAVIGLSCRFPGAPSATAFWNNLKQGKESISQLSRDALILAGVSPETADHPSYVSAAAAIADIDRFDATFFGFTPREARRMDPQHRIFLETCWEALEDAGINSFAYDGKIGLYAGASMNT
ncbi:MAG TPA: polyketide synthase, partial [Desulfobacteraceae bacterium]|nr:polyketide synthase [Desulfobacteraceae bacterium]